MFVGYKGIFLLGISILCGLPCRADYLDIPLFGDASSEAETESKSVPTSLIVQLKRDDRLPETAEVSYTSTEPNIGRKGIPLDEVVLTPPPLPKVAIDLREQPKIPEPVEEPLPQQQPEPVVNTRQDKINLPPPDQPEEVPPAPVNLANLHDVHTFDVEGFYLGMSPKAVFQMAREKGYRLGKVKKKLPLFQTSHYESLCREQGVYVPAQLRDCIRAYGQRNNQDYIEEIVLTKAETHESFHFKLTSLATGNEVYQIIYLNKGDNSLNFMPSNLAKKLSRKEAFFNAIFDKFGYPDDSKELIWGSKGHAYMQVSMTGSAYNALIKLEDVALSNEDYFAAADWKAEQKSSHHFGFAE